MGRGYEALYERVLDARGAFGALDADYRERRGHEYMLDDQVYTGRQKFAKQPGTCLNCHASLYKAYLEQGEGDITKGFEKISHMPYAEARELAKVSDHIVVQIPLVEDSLVPMARLTAEGVLSSRPPRG